MATTYRIKCLQAIFEERGDLDTTRRIWSGEGNPALESLPRSARLNRNEHGLQSHATMPGRARFDPDSGFIQSGVRLARRDTVGEQNLPVCMTFTQFEGQHERLGGMVFNLSWSAMGFATKGAFLAALQGATIYFSKARLAFNEQSGPWIPVSRDGREVWAFKIYGVAEDHYHWGRQGEAGGGYEWTYMNRWYPRIRHKSFLLHSDRNHVGLNARRYFADSYLYHREHTVSRVAWEWPSLRQVAPYATQGTAPVPVPTVGSSGGNPWTSPDVLAVIAEIVGRPGFKDGNRLALVLGFDECWNDLTQETFNTYAPGAGLNGGPLLFQFSGDADFVNAGSCQPTFDVTNPELRLTVGP